MLSAAPEARGRYCVARSSARTERVTLEAATAIGRWRVVLSAGDSFKLQMEGRDGREAFLHFVRHLRAAIARRRGATPSGAADGV